MDGAGIAAILMAAAAIDRIIDAMIAEDTDQLFNIGQMRHVFQRQRIIGQKRGDHEGEGSIFCARNWNDAVQLVAADDLNAIHALSPSGPECLPVAGCAMSHCY